MMERVTCSTPKFWLTSISASSGYNTVIPIAINNYQSKQATKKTTNLLTILRGNNRTRGSGRNPSLLILTGPAHLEATRRILKLRLCIQIAGIK